MRWIESVVRLRPELHEFADGDLGYTLVREAGYVARAAYCYTLPRILEMGTGHGKTARFLKAVVAAASVHSIDFPADEMDRLTLLMPPEQRGEVSSRQMLQAACADGVHQMYGDSRDRDNYNQEYDVIFVDAAHTREAVISDTLCALSILAPGGTLLWHDTDVPEVLNALGMISTTLNLALFMPYRIAAWSKRPEIMDKLCAECGDVRWPRDPDIQIWPHEFDAGAQEITL